MANEVVTGNAETAPAASQAPAGDMQAGHAAQAPAGQQPAGEPSVNWETRYGELQRKFNDRDTELSQARAYRDWALNDPQARQVLERQLNPDRAQQGQPNQGQPAQVDPQVAKLSQIAARLYVDPDAAAPELQQTITDIANRQARQMVGEAMRPINEERKIQRWDKATQAMKERGIDPLSPENKPKLDQTYYQMLGEYGREPDPTDVMNRAFSKDFEPAIKQRLAQEEAARIAKVKESRTLFPQSPAGAGAGPKVRGVDARFRAVKQSLLG